MVPILQLFALVSVPIIEGSVLKKKSKAVLNNQYFCQNTNLFFSTASNNVVFLIIWHSSSSSCLLLITLVWCLLASEFLDSPYLEAFHLLFANLFHDFLDWFCHKSCVVMHNIWTQFSPGGIYCFRLDGIHSFFYNNDGVFNGVILPDFCDVFSFGILFHSIDSPSRRLSCIMSLKGPHDPMI